ncbi:MAG: hypothetical protein ACR2MG_03035 [Pyrinomonadaceae bacterium]
MKKLLFIHTIFFLGFAVALNVSAQTKPFDVSDLRKIARVSDPNISPDGKSIVCIVSRANYDENRFEPELVLIDVETQAQKVLAAKRKNLQSPRWSPDGNSLAFIAASDSGTPQIIYCLSIARAFSVRPGAPSRHLSSLD